MVMSRKETHRDKQIANCVNVYSDTDIVSYAKLGSLRRAGQGSSENELSSYIVLYLTNDTTIYIKSATSYLR